MLLHSISWQEFVRGNGPKLFRYFAGRFDRATAADLAQETLIRLVQKVEVGAFRPSEGDLIAYAYGIAHFVALEFYKAQRRPHEVLTEELHAPTQSHEVVEHEMTASRLRLAVSQLPEPEQQIILLLIDQDLSLLQISQIAGLPLNTVKSHIHRAKQRLKTILVNQNMTQEDLL